MSPEPNGLYRQPRLFATGNPLVSRLREGFFKSIPAKPGVYFFHDAAGRLLYIGQSHDLRARIGSYRHVSPERHPKRTLRLVHRIARIEWQECPSPEDAKELERALLLEHRPPFNRAGVWPGSPWWFIAQAGSQKLQVHLSRQPISHPICTGPSPSAFRYAHASLMRCTFRLLHPTHKLSEFPIGLLNHTIPLSLCMKTPDAEPVAESLTAFAEGRGSAFLLQRESILAGRSPLELEFWTAELEALQKFAAKKKMLPGQQLTAPPAPLPLFPEP